MNEPRKPYNELTISEVKNLTNEQIRAYAVEVGLNRIRNNEIFIAQQLGETTIREHITRMERLQRELEG